MYRTDYLKSNAHIDIILGAKSKSDGRTWRRSRPKGLSGTSQLRMTSEDVVFTKGHAEILRNKGFRIPSQRIIQTTEIFGRAVLKEDISMGKKWTFYGKKGDYGQKNTANPSLEFYENPWLSNRENYVIPYYVDTSHSMSGKTEKSVDDHLTWFNLEFNSCIRFEKVNETVARTIDRKLQIVDGSGCWSYLGAIPADMTGQKLSLADGCYGRAKD